MILLVKLLAKETTASSFLIFFSEKLIGTVFVGYFQLFAPKARCVIKKKKTTKMPFYFTQFKAKG